MRSWISELTHVFILKDALLPGGTWNQLHAAAGRVGRRCSAMSPHFLENEYLIWVYVFSLSLSFLVGQIHGRLILLHEKDLYEKYMKNQSRLGKFQQIATNWSEINPHIQKGFTTAYRNLLIHCEKSPRIEDNKKNDIHKMIKYYEDNFLEFPTHMLHFMKCLIESLNRIRTAESHGTGTLRKWSFSMLSIDESQDFSLYNHFNDIGVFMAALRDALRELSGIQVDTM